MIVKILVAVAASALGAQLYRWGGQGPPFNTKVRDWGVPAVALCLLYYICGPVAWWVWALCFGWMFGAMTTYCKLGYQDDVYWYNWLLTGLHYGVCVLPYAWASGKWVGFGIRVIVLGVTIPLWSELISNDIWEERGRGFLTVVTIPLLLI